MKVMELIKDVVFIVGSSAVFRQMFAALQANTSWEQTEAALFVMQAVAKSILPLVLLFYVLNTPNIKNYIIYY